MGFCIMQTEALKKMVLEIQNQKCESQSIEIKAAEKGCPTRLFDTLSSFCSWSDEKAEKTFNDLCRKYAIGNINLQKTSTESEDSGRAEGSEVDLTRVTLANLEGMEKYDSNCVNIRYDGKLIGWMTYGIKGNDENGKKVVLINATIDKNYRGKHIFSYAIKQMADLYPVEIVVKRFPEYEDMALHLLNYKNVIEGK